MYSTKEALKKLEKNCAQYSIWFQRKNRENLRNGLASLSFPLWSCSSETSIGTIRMVGRVLFNNGFVHFPLFVVPHAESHGAPHGYTPRLGGLSMDYNELFCDDVATFDADEVRCNLVQLPVFESAVKMKRRIFVGRAPGVCHFYPIKVEIDCKEGKELREGSALLWAYISDKWALGDQELVQLIKQGFGFCPSLIPGLYSDSVKEIIAKNTLAKWMGRNAVPRQLTAHAAMFEWLDKEDKDIAECYDHGLTFGNTQKWIAKTDYQTFTQIQSEVMI